MMTNKMEHILNLMVDIQILPSQIINPVLIQMILQPRFPKNSTTALNAIWFFSMSMNMKPGGVITARDMKGNERKLAYPFTTASGFIFATFIEIPAPWVTLTTSSMSLYT